MAARPKGNFTVRQLRPRTRTTANGRSIIIPYVGPYDQLKALEPPLDSTVTGFPADYKVSEVSLDEGRSVEGKMTVTITKPHSEPDSNDPNPLGDPIYESDYLEERRPTEDNKRCGRLKPDRPYYEFPDRKTSTANPKKNASEAAADAEKTYKQRTWDHWQSLDADDYDASGSGTWSLAQYKSLKERGRNDYPVAFPVCTATTYHRGRPGSGQGINQEGNPPGECDPPSGYFYVKSGDRKTKQARIWTRVQTWRGYDSTDALFFNP